MSTSSGNATQTTTSAPPEYLRPYLQQGVQGAQNLYQQGGTPVTPFSHDTLTALKGAEMRAQAGSPLTQAAQGYATNTLLGSGFGSNPFIPQQSGGSTPTGAYLGQSPVNLSSGQIYTAGAPQESNRSIQAATALPPGVGGQQPTTGPIAQRMMAGQSGGFMGGAGYTNPFASGGQVNPFAQGRITNPMSQGGSNPYLDATFNQAAQQSRNALASEFARAGRNIDASAPARAEQLNNLATQIYGGAYESDANRRLAATEANLGRQYGAIESNLGRQYGATEGNLGRAFGAYQNEQGLQQGLIPFANSLANQDYYDLSQLAGVGAQREALQTQYNQQPGNALDQYLARLQGYPGGIATASTPMERNWLAGAAGGYGLGSNYGPWGGLIGGLLGGLYG